MALLLALAAPAWAQPSNADLSDLTLSAGALSPAFAPGTTSYTATVANAVADITVTPTTADATATVKVNGVAVANATASGAIPLNVGANTITAQATAGDGTTVKTYTVTVTRVLPLTVSTTSSGATCSTLGAATAIPSGGVPPYTYSWSPGNQTTAQATGLEAGTYLVMVTDSLNSLAAASTVVSTTNTLVATSSQSDPSTSVSHDGSAAVMPSGAPGPFSYAWSPSGGSSNSASSLAQGNYSVTITSANGCSIVKRFTLTAPPPHVTSVGVPASGTYGTGSVLRLIVNYDVPVSVDTTGGTPSIPLTIGSLIRNASYVSGSGTTALVFAYTVQAGDTDTDGIGVGSAIELNGGSLSVAALTLQGVGATTGVLVAGLQGPGGPAAIPTLSGWAVLMLSALAALMGLRRIRTRGASERG